MSSAGRAVGIFLQLDFPEFHVKRVVKKKTPDQRFSPTQDEFDGFGCLDEPDCARQNAENPAYGAGRGRPRRGRFGIETPVTRAFLGPENAGLAFKSRNAP